MFKIEHLNIQLSQKKSQIERQKTEISRLSTSERSLIAENQQLKMQLNLSRQIPEAESSESN